MSEEAKEKISRFFKGKSLIERYGVEKAKEMSEARRQRRLGYKFSGQALEHMQQANRKKNKEHPPHLGCKHSEATKQQISKNRRGKLCGELNPKKNKDVALKTGRTIQKRYDLGELDYLKELNRKRMLNRVVSQKTKKKLRLARIKYIEISKLHGMPICPSVGKVEKPILDNLEKCLTYKILRQYKVAGYFLDGYCPALNLAIEVDEPRHRKLKEKDLERESYIKQQLACQFFRIKTKEV